MFNRRLPGSLDRPDAFSASERTVRELKSENPKSIAEGWRQVNRYREHLEGLTGDSWTACVDVYRP